MTLPTQGAPATLDAPEGTTTHPHDGGASTSCREAPALPAAPDPQLSWAARGLLSFLLTFPDDSPPSRMDIDAATPDGKAGTSKAIRELELRGHLRRAMGSLRRPGYRKVATAASIYQVAARPWKFPPLPDGMTAVLPALPNEPDGTWSGSWPLGAKDPRPPKGQSVVYLLYTDTSDKPCYIGSTGDWHERMKRHRAAGKQWARWVVIPCDSRQRAFEVESSLIDLHRPPLNGGGSAVTQDRGAA